MQGSLATEFGASNAFLWKTSLPFVNDAGQVTPSSLLAALCHRVTAEPLLSGEVERRLDDLVDRGLQPFATSADPLDDLDLDAVAALRPMPLVDLIERLDVWHNPLGELFDQRVDGHDLHEAARRTARLTGRLNAEGPGLLIVRAARWTTVALAETVAAADPLNQLLQHTSYIPAHLPAGDPDEPDSDTAFVRHRDIAVRIVTVAEDAAAAWPRDGEALRVGIAPLAETAHCVSAETIVAARDGGADRNWYRIINNVAVARAAAALDALADAGAHVVVLPEMGIRAGDLPDLRRAVRRAANRPGSRLVLVGSGAIGTADGEGGFGSNRFHLFDGLGRELAAHDKLCRWNLDTARAAGRFGAPWDAVDAACFPVSYEDIACADTITIVDIPGFGRLAMMICADMSSREPLAWLARNLLVDWIFAPIMDASITWRPGSAPQTKWIVREADRVVGIARSRVVVTNSVAMTHWQNARNAAAARPVDDDCGIALLVDGRFGPRTHRLRRAPLAELGGVAPWTTVEPWDAGGWEAWPAP